MDQGPRGGGGYPDPGRGRSEVVRRHATADGEGSEAIQLKHSFQDESHTLGILRRRVIPLNPQETAEGIVPSTGTGYRCITAPKAYYGT
eukprot:scaffold3319_cov258-Pinguiococcus_pyrenoidosus.AAC.23